MSKVPNNDDMLAANAEVIEFSGYKGPGLDYPRKYVQGQLKDAYLRQNYKPPVQEYDSTCKDLGAQPNSHVKELLTSQGVALTSSEVLGGESVSLRQTYVGEKGFIALLPLLNANTRWRYLDASNNGLRNEAVLHLVDMLLRPAHTGTNRRLYIDLSRNPISEGAGKALTELVKLHPGIESLNLSMTKIPRHHRERIKGQIERNRKTRDPDPGAEVPVAEAPVAEAPVAEAPVAEAAVDEEKVPAKGDDSDAKGAIENKAEETVQGIDGNGAEEHLRDMLSGDAAASVDAAE